MKNAKLLTILSLSLFWAQNSFAITITPNPYIYGSGEIIYVNCDVEDGSRQYHFGMDDPIGDGSSCDDTQDGTPGFQFWNLLNVSGHSLPHSFYVFEFNDPNSGDCLGLTTQECLTANLPDMIGYTILSVTAQSSGNVEESGITNFQPRIDITSHRQETSAGKEVEIKYEARDENDPRNYDWGLGEKPVSIYYSYNYGDYGLGQAVLVAKDLPAIGSYIWKTEGLDNGYYWINVVAEDKTGQKGYTTSPAILIDSSEPTFLTKTEPVVTKGEDVKIIVESSEELLESPNVTVIQKGSSYIIPVKMISAGLNKYEGTYSLIKGLDGTAKINIEGKDKAGNKGTTILNGGYFFVGVNPPPKPEIIAPIDFSVVATGSLEVTGRAREDSKVLLLVNGTEKYDVMPDAEGNFIFKNVKIYPEYNKGLNFLSITTQDPSGQISEAVGVNVKYNIAPEASILYPDGKVTIDGPSFVRTEIKDINKDRLTLAYEIRKEGDEIWSVLANRTEARTLRWDSTKFTPGNYQIKVKINDGTTETETISNIFTIDRFLPAISFTGGDSSYINGSTAVIDGTVATPKGDKILSLEYSLDSGKTWKNVTVADGNLDSGRENFHIIIDGLKSEQNIIMFRAKDEKELVAQNLKNIIIDKNPPELPVVLSPAELSVVSAGFDVIGTAEPGASVSVLSGNEIFIGITESDGSFIVKNIKLEGHGENILRFYATDRAGNKGPEGKLKIIYNNPPVLKFINPRPDRGLSGQEAIKWEVTDSDGDSISEVKLSYRLRGGIFKDLSTTKLNTFDWNVSSLPEGNYQLRIEASDIMPNGSLTGFTIVDFSIDNKPPTVYLEPFKENIFTKKFVLQARGRAVDDFSGVEYVEFSVDKTNWFKTTLTGGFLRKEAAFAFNKQLELEDGEYELLVRSVDAAGNLSLPVKQKIYIDTKAPRVGSFTLSDGRISLLPENGNFKIFGDRNLKFSLSLEADTESASLVLADDVNQNKIELFKNNATGLWEAVLGGNSFNISKSKNLSMVVTAEDKFGNIAENVDIGSIELINGGKITGTGGVPMADAKITIFVSDQRTNSFVRWQGEEYGLNNPVDSSGKGEYELTLPAGTYYLVIRKQDYQKLRTSDFTLDRPSAINFDFELQPREGIRGAIENFLEEIQ